MTSNPNQEPATPPETTDFHCPNCGYPATDNYCANCGQQNHLHKDTFWGLISHFTAHYFHYDSKFWKTIKALIFSPGTLTLAYQQKKRQRYIPPISLYIFVSIVFFLLLPIFQTHLVNVRDNGAPAREATVSTPSSDSLTADSKRTGETDRYSEQMKEGLMSDLSDNPEAFKEKVIHAMPKLFFFMIPLLAALLKLFLRRQKQYFFVDHAVFALHIHSFVFLICLIGLINPFEQLQSTISNITLLVCFLYYIIAIHQVYKSGWAKSFFIGLGTAALYFILLLVLVVLGLWLLVELGH